MNGNIMATLLSKWSTRCFESWKWSRIFLWLIHSLMCSATSYTWLYCVLLSKCTTLAITNNKRNWNALLWVKVLIRIVKLIYPFQLHKPDSIFHKLWTVSFFCKILPTIFISIICDWFFSFRFVCLCFIILCPCLLSLWYLVAYNMCKTNLLVSGSAIEQ